MTIELDLPTDKIKGVIKGAAGHIIFNNPERHNAVSLEMWDPIWDKPILWIPLWSWFLAASENLQVLFQPRLELGLSRKSSNRLRMR